MNISERLTKLCENQNITIAELAKKAKMTSSTLYDIKNGKNENPRIDTIIKICRVSDIGIDEFLEENTNNRLKSTFKKIEELNEKDKEYTTRMIEAIIKGIAEKK